MDVTKECHIKNKLYYHLYKRTVFSGRGAMKNMNIMSSSMTLGFRYTFWVTGLIVTIRLKGTIKMGFY